MLNLEKRSLPRHPFLTRESNVSSAAPGEYGLGEGIGDKNGTEFPGVVVDSVVDVAAGLFIDTHGICFSIPRPKLRLLDLPLGSPSAASKELANSGKRLSLSLLNKAADENFSELANKSPKFSTRSVHMPSGSILSANSNNPLSSKLSLRGAIKGSGKA